jgi:hypothetical protein
VKISCDLSLIGMVIAMCVRGLENVAWATEGVGAVTPVYAVSHGPCFGCVESPASLRGHTRSFTLILGLSVMLRLASLLDLSTIYEPGRRLNQPFASFSPGFSRDSNEPSHFFQIFFWPSDPLRYLIPELFNQPAENKC